MPTSIKPAFTKNNLAIVFSTDSNYVPYMAVSIQSIIDNSDKNYNYDILVFDDGITTYQKEQLSQMLKSNVSLRYIDVKPLLATLDYSLFKSRGIWSSATFYRLFIPQLMSDYDKVLYLDCDVLVKDSLVDLFKIDLGKAEAGCCYDELHYSAHSDRIKDIAKSKTGINILIPELFCLTSKILTARNLLMVLSKHSRDHIYHFLIKMF